MRMACGIRSNGHWNNPLSIDSNNDGLDDDKATLSDVDGRVRFWMKTKVSKVFLVQMETILLQKSISGELR